MSGDVVVAAGVALGTREGGTAQQQVRAVIPRETAGGKIPERGIYRPDVLGAFGAMTFLAFNGSLRLATKNIPQ